MSARWNRKQDTLRDDLKEYQVNPRYGVPHRPYVDRRTAMDLEQRDLERAMRRWGVDPNRDAQHKLFWTQAKSVVADSVAGKNPLVDLACPVLTLLNGSWEDTAAQILYFDIKQSMTGDSCKDLLTECYPDLPFKPPYFFNRATNTYETISEYQHLSSPELLNPFLRFLLVPAFKTETEVRERLLGQQYQTNDLVLQALIVYHAIATTNQACLQCGCRSLCWNKCDDSNVWRNMMCSSCPAMYEIRTKKGLETKLSRGTIDAMGRFDVYHHLKSEKPDRKMFCVMVDIDSLTNQLEYPIQVHAAEITHVTPFCKPKSFQNDLRIYSSITVKNAKRWFVLPTDTTEDRARMLVDDAITRFFLYRNEHNTATSAAAAVQNKKKEQTGESNNKDRTIEQLQNHVRGLRRQRNHNTVALARTNALNGALTEQEQCEWLQKQSDLREELKKCEEDLKILLG